jgi:asparagine synthase (glutamine-hydrolysing)
MISEVEGGIVKNAIGETLNEEIRGLSVPQIIPWSWQGWSKSFVEHKIYLFLNGFAEPNPDSGNRIQSSDHSEHQILVNLYRQWGVNFIEHLRGSFALALWDAPHQLLILATDHFGTRPIYYTMVKGRIGFAPRISAFARNSEFVPEIDLNSVYFYLNHSFIPAPFTIYKGVQRLEPGCVLQSKDQRCSVHRYWDMAYPEDSSLTESAAADLVRESLNNSVHFALTRLSGYGNKVGAFLSGGTDSSTLVGLMTKQAGQSIKSFSVGFKERAYNELDYARIAAKHFGSIAHEYIVHPNEALEALDQMTEAYDEPFANSSAIPTFFCLRMAKDSGIKVMFAGDGGDELFGGNERYVTERMFEIYHRIPLGLKGGLNYLCGLMPDFAPARKIRNYVRKANQPAVDRFFAYQLYYYDHAEEFLSNDFRSCLDHEFPISLARGHYARAVAINPLNKLLYVDLKLAISDNDLFKVNRMAEIHGIDVRYPYLDPYVGSASGRIPACFKVKRLTKRYIFKKAFADFLPKQILNKKKHGFGLPTGDWLRSHSGFRDLARSLLLDSRSIGRGYFNRCALEGLLKAHDDEHSSYFGSHIWNFMMLELWHRKHADPFRSKDSYAS